MQTSTVDDLRQVAYGQSHLPSAFWWWQSGRCLKNVGLSVTYKFVQPELLKSYTGCYKSSTQKVTCSNPSLRRRQHGFSYNLWFQGRVIQLGVVKVPLGKVHVDLAQEAVPAKGVVMPHGQNERLGSEVLHANTILQRQQGGRSGSEIVSVTAIANKRPWESVTRRQRRLTLRISLNDGLSVFFFTEVFLFPRLALSGNR